MGFDDYRYIECYCPQCHKTHHRMVEKAHAGNPDVWRKGKKLVLLCNECKGKIYRGDE